MMKPVIIAAALFATGTAFAAEVPTPGNHDSRMRYVDYEPAEVYKIKGVYRTALQIIFGDGEEVLNIALGDTVSWEVAPSGNIIYLKPREQAGPTNLIVTTKLGSEIHNYNFELSARTGTLRHGSDAVFQVRFRYPARQREALRVAQQRAQYQKAMAVEGDTINLALSAAVTQGKRNLDYELAGSGDLQPSEVTDNGQFTVLRFPRDFELPAFFKVLPDGSEAIVNFDVRGEFVVLHEVARQIRLRRGKKMLCIWNNAYDPYGADYSSGTASPYVDRKVEGQE
jgi:type IV secretion system protein VirB9